MIAVDTSVFVAIFLQESDSARFTDALASAPNAAMSAGNYLEAAMVASRKAGGLADLDAWLDRFEIAVVPVDLPLARLAADAFARFGKGRHAAGLNYGDCFSYALAQSLRAPLLFKGDDFARTDVAPALAA